MSEQKIKKLNDFENIIDLINYFSTKEKSLDYLKNCRWKDGKYCPHCKHNKVYEFKDNRRFRCAKCLKHFTATVGTIFEKSPIPLQKWYVAIYFVGCHKKGISSYQLAKNISVTQATAWFMLHRIRQTFKQSQDKLSGVIQIDETFVGGKNKNRHIHKKVVQRGDKTFKDKAMVVGFLDDKEKVRLRVMPKCAYEGLPNLVRDTVHNGSIIVTDEWKTYIQLGTEYEHQACNHKRKKFVSDEGFTTNGIENIFMMVKKTIIGNYHNVSHKHLSKFVDEVAFRYNTRNVSEGEKVNLMMSNLDNRLTYKKLIQYGQEQRLNNRGCGATGRITPEQQAYRESILQGYAS